MALQSCPVGLCILTQAERFPRLMQGLCFFFFSLIRNSNMLPCIINQFISIERINWCLSGKLSPGGR